MPQKHVILQGESAISLAEHYGLFAATIWDDPANAELKKKRRDMNVLLPGDELTIPDKTVKNVPCATGARHVFRRRGVPAVFRLQLFELVAARANQEYTLTVDSSLELKGQTDEQGVLEQYVPTGAKRGELVIGPDAFHLELLFGNLDPHDELTGIQHRLNNIGFACGVPDGTLNDATRDALLEFQLTAGLEPTGETDPATIEKIASVHDEVGRAPRERQTSS